MLTSLNALESQMDDTDEITLEQCEAHFEQFKEARQKTDRLINYLEFCKTQKLNYAKRASDFKNEADKWGRREENLEEYALFLLKKNPQLEMLGTDFELKTKKNPPKLICAYRTSKSLGNYIPESFIPLIDAEFLEEIKITVLKSGELKDALKAGKICDFARIENDIKLLIKPKIREIK